MSNWSTDSRTKSEPFRSKFSKSAFNTFDDIQKYAIGISSGAKTKQKVVRVYGLTL